MELNGHSGVGTVSDELFILFFTILLNYIKLNISTAAVSTSYENSNWMMFVITIY
jgi:hypothetical protein